MSFFKLREHVLFDDRNYVIKDKSIIDGEQYYSIANQREIISCLESRLDRLTITDIHRICELKINAVASLKEKMTGYYMKNMHLRGKTDEL